MSQRMWQELPRRTDTVTKYTLRVFCSVRLSNLWLYGKHMDYMLSFLSTLHLDYLMRRVTHHLLTSVTCMTTCRLQSTSWGTSREQLTTPDYCYRMVSFLHIKFTNCSFTLIWASSQISNTMQFEVPVCMIRYYPLCEVTCQVVIWDFLYSCFPRGSLLLIVLVVHYMTELVGCTALVSQYFVKLHVGWVSKTFCTLFSQR